MSLGQNDERIAGEVIQLDLARPMVPVVWMAPHTRATIAASAFAFITGMKVAGMHDHSTGKDLRIAAECRGDRLQGYDGDRAVGFGGELPEIYDAGTRSFVSLEIDGANAQGFDRLSSTAFSAQITDQRVQLYDHGKSAWFTYDIEVVRPTTT